MVQLLCVAITTQDLQRALDDARDDARLAALTVREQLRLNERKFGDILKGGQLLSVGANQSNSTFAVGGNSYTLPEIVRGFRDLITFYDACQRMLVTAGSASEDSDIVTEMLARLQPVYSTRGDISRMREVY